MKKLCAEAAINAQQFNNMVDRLLSSLGYPQCVDRLRIADRLYSSYKSLYKQTVGAHMSKLLYGNPGLGITPDYVIGTVFASKTGYATLKARYPFAPSLLDWLYRETAAAMRQSRCPYCGGRGHWDRRYPVTLPKCKDCGRNFYSL